MLNRDQAYFDQVSWRCARPCRKTACIRDGTFLAQLQQNLKLGIFIRLVFKWTLGPTAISVANELSIDRRVVERLFVLLRDCCTRKLRRNPINVGTANFVVQIDESMFNHKQRAHVGRVAREPVWVFGMVDTSFSPAKGYCEIVLNGIRYALRSLA